MSSLPYKPQGCRAHQQLTDRPDVTFDPRIKKLCLSWCMFWHICQVWINFIIVTAGLKTASSNCIEMVINFIKTAIKV